MSKEYAAEFQCICSIVFWKATGLGGKVEWGLVPWLGQYNQCVRPQCCMYTEACQPWIWRQHVPLKRVPTQKQNWYQEINHQENLKSIKTQCYMLKSVKK
jgi:hypothetical protein